jgi:CDP-paratose 2-epimerase
MSLAELTAWCDERFGPHAVGSRPHPRPFDVPWLVMDCARARETWDWQPTTRLPDLLDGIADHARRHPDWLALSEAGEA